MKSLIEKQVGRLHLVCVEIGEKGGGEGRGKKSVPLLVKDMD